ncbi:NAD-dependent epimerase/dehydratase family protein [Actinotalea sp. M2MS4P-6]|uniref:NAD-dependent epimerase/dehydratase family protein n=1 Tax=Actinotalea sp. M2MS4P-6 TaxID=2983762 RepID=UPI0021E35B09|nr:NAD-dependent epimerase/dehydratase family protein [Actinotalea sp. M2MS4P-6]MCV2395115.1 NAD-dependent epimerase/dehydratase family protein [Actinotalea sp. M2MS4P-6]
MTDQSPVGTVLVTGVTGYLAQWVVVELANRGHRVRGTVRDLGRAEPARRAMLEQCPPGADLELVQADLLDDAGWDAAFAGVEAVLHTASPMPFDDLSDLVVSAREGTRRVLTTAARSGVRRVVVTSSGTVAQPADPTLRSTEETWSEPSGDAAHVYPDSKILAERLAWQLGADLGLDLTTILPSFMQGPPVGRPTRSGTIDVIRRLLDGALPALPRLGWNVVDVRDVARLHVLALEDPSTIGERYHGAGTFVWYRDIARMLREEMPEARKVPTRQLPDVLVRLAARRDAHLAMIVGELGITRDVDTAKARTQLGWTTRPVRTTVVDTARAIIASGPESRSPR